MDLRESHKAGHGIPVERMRWHITRGCRCQSCDSVEQSKSTTAAAWSSKKAARKWAASRTKLRHCDHVRPASVQFNDNSSSTGGTNDKQTAARCTIPREKYHHQRALSSSLLPWRLATWSEREATGVNTACQPQRCHYSHAQVFGGYSNVHSKRSGVWKHTRQANDSVLHPASQRMPCRATIVIKPAARATSNSEYILSQMSMMGVTTILGFQSLRLPRTIETLESEKRRAKGRTSLTSRNTHLMHSRKCLPG
jgi:hypothetical protein